jgi:GNAT superfamily N-acetyltransferase
LTSINYFRATAENIEELSSLRCEFLNEINSLDENAITELYLNCKEYFINAFNEGSFVAWLAELNGEIIATSGICFYKVPPNKSCPNGRVAYIQNMYTKAEHRKNGIAKKLFSKMIEEAKNNGCKKILLNATDMGKPLYQKFGFEDTKGDMELTI